MKLLKRGNEIVNLDHLALIEAIDIVNPAGVNRVFFNAYKNLNRGLDNKICFGKIDNLKDKKTAKKIADSFTVKILEEAKKEDIIDVEAIIEEIKKEIK